MSVAKSCLTCAMGPVSTCVICPSVCNFENGYKKWQPSARIVPEIESDVVNHPAHYTTGDIECIDAMESSSTREEFLGHLKLTAMKYIWRLGKKDNTLQDAKKAKWYLDKYIETLEKNHG